MSMVRRPAAVAATLAGTLAIAGSFAVGGRTPTFVVAPVGSVMTNLTPGWVMAFAIGQLGDFAQKLALLAALGLTLGLFAAIARAALWVGDRARLPFAAAVVGFVAAWVAAVGLTVRPVASLAAALPLAAALAAAEWRWQLGRQRPTRAERRSVLRAGAGVAALSGASLLRGWTLVGSAGGPLGRVAGREVENEAMELVEEAAGRSLSVTGMEPLVSDRFYQVDINTVNPNPKTDEWSLSVTGAVEEELELSYEDVLDRELEHRFTSLRCVGDPINGPKLDTALWTGIPASRLLEEAGVASGCECVMLRAADDYYEEFPLAALETGFLAVGMNGKVLPRGHGNPLRALVPGHWGEVNVKWLTEIEVLEREAKGYWEKRGWHGTGPVTAVAKIHATNHRGGKIQVGGHAYAGTRGVRRVEVSIDGGDTWTDATLSDPLPGTRVPDPGESPTRQAADGLAADFEGITDVWRQWVHEFEPTQDSHEVIARVVDGQGNVQPKKRRKPFPRGATGWVRKTVKKRR